LLLVDVVAVGSVRWLAAVLWLGLVAVEVVSFLAMASSQWD